MALAASMAATMLAGCSGGGSNVETTKAAGENNAQAGDNTAQAGDNTAGEAAEGYESYKLRTDLKLLAGSQGGSTDPWEQND